MTEIVIMAWSFAGRCSGLSQIGDDPGENEQHDRGGVVNQGLAELEKQAQTMIDDLLWWTMALKTARKA